MEIITAIKALVATISATILTLFGAVDPVSLTTTPAPMPQVEVSTEAQASTTVQTQPTSTTTPSEPEPQPDPIVTAFELGKEVGKLEAQSEIIEQALTPTTTPTPQPTPTPTPTPQPAPQPTPEPEPLVEATPESMKSIDIISPIPGKGLGREYTAQDPIVDESNYIELGLVVRNDEGKNVKDVEVVITGTDESQNKTLNSTGNVKKIYNSDGSHETVHFYPFHYEFKTVGDHTITFSVPSLNLSEEVTLTMTEPDPA